MFCVKVSGHHNETTGSFPMGGQLIYTIRATLVSSNTIVTDTATVTTANGLGDPQPGNNRVTDISTPGGASGTDLIYLPIIFKNFVPGPDLVVVPGSLMASSNAVTVAIQNISTTAVNDTFWVDVYINPSPAPPQLYQSGDLYWGLEVANGGVPLASGQIITLTLINPYFVGGNPFPIIPGSHIYAQVDSFGPNPYGAVQETNETNNVSGPAVSIVGVGGSPVIGGAEPQLVSGSDLPPRD